MLIDKPWGSEEIWTHTKKYVGKILKIKAGHRLSLQYHKEKMESIIVITGVLTLVHNEKINVLGEGESFDIYPLDIHRMEANHGDVVLIEVSTPELEDLTRLDDDYDRS